MDFHQDIWGRTFRKLSRMIALRIMNKTVRDQYTLSKWLRTKLPRRLSITSITCKQMFQLNFIIIYDTNSFWVFTITRALCANIMAILLGVAKMPNAPKKPGTATME